ncbi:hypothetical protein Dimus_031920 [Dionaea muscipula]
MKEKRKVVEERLPKQLEFARKEAIGIALVRELLNDDDELILVLEKLQINPKVRYKKEPIPSIKGEPTVWVEDFEADPMNFIKAWGIEADVLLNPPCPVKMVLLTPPITASEAPSTSTSDAPPLVPTTTPHNSK